MKKLRIIARLDVKNEHVIKGIHLEGLRKVGLPNELAKRYYEQGADEILLMDAVASLYERNGLFEITARACQEVFVPITVAGGIRCMRDIELALKAGADKVGINTQAIKSPEFIREASRTYGAQCVVVSIEAKRKADTWEAYISNGREPTGIRVLDWIARLEQLGAGEILLTSVDQEGTKRGFDLELARQASALVNIPIIICGGAGRKEHVQELLAAAPVDAVALASCLHYQLHTIEEIKRHLQMVGVPVRL